MKNTTVELQQGVAELMLEAANYYAMPHANRISMNGYNDPWVGPEFAETVTPRYLNSRAASIFGGSREVQKNIVAKVVLGL
jgi:alkylation response protein AidB-like acyl-CoA dehydrogenase